MIGSRSLHGLASRVLGQVAPLPVHALAVVVELGSRAEQAILQRVALAAQISSSGSGCVSSCCGCGCGS